MEGSAGFGVITFMACIRLYMKNPAAPAPASTSTDAPTITPTNTMSVSVEDEGEEGGDGDGGDGGGNGGGGDCAVTTETFEMLSTCTPSAAEAALELPAIGASACSVAEAIV